MSVIRFDKREIGQLAKTIYDLPKHADYFLTNEERLENVSVKGYIGAFFDRLFVANQVCAIYQYGDKVGTSIERLEETDCIGTWLEDRKLWDKLRSLQYNLFTNGGSSFVSEKDLDRLESIISRVGTRIIQKDMIEQ